MFMMLVQVLILFGILVYLQDAYDPNKRSRKHDFNPSNTKFDGTVLAGFGDFYVKNNMDWNNYVRTDEEVDRLKNPTNLYNTAKYRQGMINTFTEIFLNENGTNFDSEYSESRIPANTYASFIDGTMSPGMYRGG